MRVQANRIYVIPPNKYLTIAGNTLRLSEPVLDHGRRMSVDFFFQGLARERRGKAICVILTGTGTDGTLGLRAVKAEGGLAMAQSPEMAQHGGMPQSAIAGSRGRRGGAARERGVRAAERARRRAVFQA